MPGQFNKIEIKFIEDNSGYAIEYRNTIIGRATINEELYYEFEDNKMYEYDLITMCDIIDKINENYMSDIDLHNYILGIYDRNNY